MVFPLNSISRATTYSKIPRSLSSHQCKTLIFSFSRARSFGKEASHYTHGQTLAVFSVANPWLNWSLQFVSKLIQNLPFKCSRHYRGVVHAPLGCQSARSHLVWTQQCLCSTWYKNFQNIEKQEWIRHTVTGSPLHFFKIFPQSIHLSFVDFSLLFQIKCVQA